MLNDQIVHVEGTTSLPRLYPHEPVILFLALVMAFNPWIPGLSSFADSAASDSASIDKRIIFIWMALYGLAALTFAFSASRPGFLRAIPIPIIVLPLLALLSTAWSRDNGLTLARSVALCGTTIIGIYTASRYTTRGFMRLLGWVIVAIGLCSAAVAVAHPSIGIDPHYAHVWRGILDQKNSLGAAMSLGALIWIMESLVSARRVSRFLCLGASLACILMLLKSDSRTSMLVLGSTLLVGAGVAVLRSRSGFIGPALILFSLVFFATAQFALVRYESPSFDADDLLTGRPQLWSLVIRQISAKPILGNGYDALWDSKHGLPSPFRAELHWVPRSAHDGFLDLSLSLGLVGLGFGLWMLALAFVRAQRKAIAKHSSAEAALPFLILTWGVLMNVSESRLLTYNRVYWIILVVVCIHVAWQHHDIPRKRQVSDVYNRRYGWEMHGTPYAPVYSAFEKRDPLRVLQSEHCGEEPPPAAAPAQVAEESFARR